MVNHIDTRYQKHICLKPYIIIKVTKLVTNVKDALMNTINMQLKPTCDPRMKNITTPS
jgi:hypothetical protein